MLMIYRMPVFSISNQIVTNLVGTVRVFCLKFEKMEAMFSIRFDAVLLRH